MFANESVVLVGQNTNPRTHLRLLQAQTLEHLALITFDIDLLIIHKAFLVNQNLHSITSEGHTSFDLTQID